MRKPFSSPVLLSVTMMFLFLGCQAISSPASLPPTFTPSPAASLDESPTPCLGAYTWAYGSVPPEFVPRVQEAMTASGLEGSVQASTFGENNGCGEYLVKDVDYHFTLNVQNLEANEDLATKATSVLEIARRFVDESSAPNLGHLQLTFLSGDQQCDWAYESGAWTFQSGNVANGAACQVPTSAESERMAEVLADLAVDLACETSTVKADTLHAELECERPEGQDRYIVTVNFSAGNLDYAEACFHGWRAREYNLTGDEPMTVTEGGSTYYERDRSFQWSASGTLFSLLERIKGGPDVTLPADTREKIYLRALQAGLISGEGSDCQ